jgi:hypothetical protein
MEEDLRRPPAESHPVPESASLSRQLAQLNQMRQAIRQETERLQAQRPAAIKRTSPTMHQRSVEPKPKKTRGTFLGLRRWLGGGGD